MNIRKFHYRKIHKELNIFPRDKFSKNWKAEHSKLIFVLPLHRRPWLFTLKVDSRRRWTRTVKFRTAVSRPCLVGQTDNEQFFSKIRTESGQRTESRQKKSGQTDIGIHFLQISGQNSDGGQKSDRQNADSGQTPDTIFREIRTKPDKDRKRTVPSADVW